MFSEYIDFLDKYEVDLVEVSDGSYDIEHNKKLEYISILAEKFTVISEVGSKKANVVYSPDEWVSMMKSELKAGSVKVIAEARESGTTGIYNEDGSINNKIICAISDHVKLENVLWEAPLKSQQAWFIKTFRGKCQSWQYMHLRRSFRSNHFGSAFGVIPSFSFCLIDLKN